jgi:eukaryotic-like serine/threonine-protein kinase
VKRCPRCNAEVEGSCLHCLASAALSPTEERMLVAGKYALGEEIGRGGMGQVYRAEQVGLARTVAIKFLLLDPEASDAERAQQRQRFEREAKALARVSHPGIVQVIEFGEDEGQPFVAMEWAEGEPLSAKLNGQAIEAQKLVGWGIELADCLGHAHERGVLHRDVKPSNILLTRDAEPRIRLIDFGIARSLDHNPALPTVTRASLVVGTPGYLAPESLRGAEPDARQDIYALGATLYAMSAGVLDSDPLKKPLLALLEELIAVAPEARPASMADVRTRLSALKLAVPGLPSPTKREIPSTSDDSFWNTAMALLLTLTTAVGFWVAIVSVTPKVVATNELMPLTFLLTEPLPDGRVISRARFEPGPSLAFIAALGITIVALGFLRALWRRSTAPVLVVRSHPWNVLRLGMFIILVHGTRLAFEYAQLGTGTALHVFVFTALPLFGGILEVAMLFYLFASLLERARDGAPLFRDIRIWGGAALALVPPTHTFFQYLSRWHP